MSTAIHLIYENGVFRPMQPVDLPEHSEVEAEIRTIKNSGANPSEQEFPEEVATRLSDRDRDRFLQLVEEPPPPNTALRKAISKHAK